MGTSRRTCVYRSVQHIRCLRYAADVLSHFCVLALSCTCLPPFCACKPLHPAAKISSTTGRIPDAPFSRAAFLKLHEFFRSMRVRGGEGVEGGVQQLTSMALVFWKLASTTKPNPLALFILRVVCPKVRAKTCFRAGEEAGFMVF